MDKLFLFAVGMAISGCLLAQPKPSIVSGAERLDLYLPLIKGKRIGVFANQTSMVGTTHLVDTLSTLGVTIKAIFGPEHGFRGTADAGEKIGNTVDAKTNIPIISLYGNKRKPSADDLKDIDLLIFDIQDVGVRFYTYISSLQELMEACFENNISLLILDRPNPNGNYVDGPVLEKKFKSFIGMQPVPVVYGMTIGEYAQMIAEEKWLSENSNAKYTAHKNEGKTPLQIIQCLHYTHKSTYTLPVKPSPNLPNTSAIYLYPSVCFFEGTVLSEGRGTDKPFQVIGHPTLPKHLFTFTPKPTEGARNSKLYGQLCYGWNLSASPEQVRKKVNNKIQLAWLLEAYRLFPKKDSFFIIPKATKTKTVLPEDIFFNKLAGNALLIQQIKERRPEAQIRRSWEADLKKFKVIRKKYLLYEDFE